MDFKGYRLDIGWGFNTISGNRPLSTDPTGPPAIIFRQRRLSYQGRVILELYGLSLWNLLDKLLVNEIIQAPIEWRGNTTTRHILMRMMAGSFFDAVIQEDASPAGFSDQTANAKSITVDDTLLLPTPPAVGDVAYFGSSNRFNRLSIDIKSGGVGGDYTVVWEYWNGTIWTALSGVTDDTSGFQVTGLKIVSFTHPGTGWVTNTVNGQGPFFYVRARVATIGIPIQPKATYILGGLHQALALDTSDALQGDDYLPDFQTTYISERRALVQAALTYTLLGVRTRSDGFHLVYVDNAQVTPDYTYDSAHAFFSDIQDSSPIIPNKVIYVDRIPSSAEGEVSGSADNTASQDALGIIATVIFESKITAANATTQAERRIKRSLRDANQGLTAVPINVGQEVWDLVRIVDGRTGVTFSGRVTGLTRTYEAARGIYILEIRMGGYDAIALAIPDWLLELPETSRLERDRELEVLANRLKKAAASTVETIQEYLARGGEPREVT